MVNFGLDWVFLVSVNEEELFEYEKLLYDHELPFKTIETREGYNLEVPEKYVELSRSMILDYQEGILDTPVNDFNPRYSTFERGRKVRFVPKRFFRGNYVFLLILMLFMLMFQMMIYLKK